MESSHYEAHIMKSPALPFILHIGMVKTEGIVASNWHTNIEILRCTEGCGWVMLDDRRVPFYQCDIVVVNSNSLHKVDSDSGVKYDVLIIDQGFCTENGIPTDEIIFEEHICGDSELCRAFDDVVNCRGSKLGSC